MSKRSKKRRQSRANGTAPAPSVEQAAPAPEEKQINQEPQRTGFWYTQIPNYILRDTRLTSTAFRLYAALASYANAEKVCWPGQQRLAQDLGVSERTIRVRLKELEEAGYITIRRRGRQQTNVYCLKDLPDRANESDRNRTPSTQSDRNLNPRAEEVTGISASEVSGIEDAPNENQQKNKSQLAENENQQTTEIGAAGAAASFSETEDENFSAILQTYATEIGSLSPAIKKKLAKLSEKFSAAWFEEAVAEATFYNATHKLAYAIKVMERWQEDGHPAEAREEVVVEENYEEIPSVRTRGMPVPKPPQPVIFAPVCEIFEDTQANYSFAEAWMGTMGQLQLQMDRGMFNWIEGARAVDLEGDTLIVCAPNRHAQALMEQRLLPSLERTVTDIVGHVVTLKIIDSDEWMMPAA